MSMYFPSSDSSSIGSNIKSNSTDLESSSAASSSQQLATWSGVGLTIPSPDEQQANRTIFQKFCDKAYATFLGVPQTLLRMYHSITGWADPEVLKTRSARINALFSGNKKIAELEYQKLEAQKRRDNFLVLGAEIKISNLKKAIALERGDHEVAEAYRNAAVSFEKEFSLLQKQAEELEKGDTSGVAEIYARAAEASHHAAKAYGEQAVVLEREDHGVAEAYRNAAVSFEKEFLFLKQQAEELKKGDTSGMAGIYARAAEASQYAAKAYGEQAVRLPQYVEDLSIPQCYAYIAQNYAYQADSLHKKAKVFGDTQDINKQTELAKIYEQSAQANRAAAQAYEAQAVALEREDHGVAEAYRNAAVSFEKEFLFLKQQAEELKKGDTSGMAGIYARAAEASQYAAKAYGEQAVRLPQYVEDLSIPQCYAYIAQNYAYQADSLHKKAKVFGDTQDINKQTELAKIYEQSAQANRAAAQAYEAQAVALEREDHGVAQVYGNAAVSFEKEFLFLKQQAEELKKGDTSGIAGIYEQTAKASQMLGEMYLKKTGYLLSGSNNQICDRIIEASNYEVSYFQHRYRIWVSKESEEGVRAALLAYNQCAIETIRKAREHDLAIINTPSNQSLLEDPEQSESNFFQEAMSLGEKVEAMLFIHLQMIENSDNAQKEQTSEISKQLYSKANAFRLEQFEALENNDLTSVEEKKKMAINSEKEAYHGSFGGVDPISSTYEITRKIFGDDEKYDAFEAERSRLFRLPRNAQTPQKISSPITTEETSEKSHHLDLSSDSDDEEESRR